MTFLLNAPLPIPITFAVVFALTLENYDRVMVIGLYFAINIPLSIVTGHLVGVALSRFKPWKVWLLFGGSSVSIYSSFDLLARRVLFG
ncbi:MAG: hypothetical protein SFV19_06545 [Rhodospirillaceae bacterium]|nr:hypothetical protein [Rhodospirillaceae bacterium]